jgi:hypothetical protein
MADYIKSKHKLMKEKEKNNLLYRNLLLIILLKIFSL